MIQETAEKNADLVVTRAHRKSPNRILPKNLINDQSRNMDSPSRRDKSNARKQRKKLDRYSSQLVQSKYQYPTRIDKINLQFYQNADKLERVSPKQKLKKKSKTKQINQSHLISRDQMEQLQFERPSKPRIFVEELQPVEHFRRDGANISLSSQISNLQKVNSQRIDQRNQL